MDPDYASLRAYIDTQRRSGVTDTVIHQNLHASGWPDATVQQVLIPLPQSVSISASASDDGFFSGRIRRLGFLMAIVYFLAYFVAALAISFIGHGSRIINIVTVLMGMLAILAVIPILISIHIRRWHDLNQSGWLTLLNLIPFIGLIISVALLFIPGSVSANTYGNIAARSLSPRSIFGFAK
ncbi:DUF805 domain-containing protein [Polaromonas sp.]|nr:DUF805 domain-containing protein [Candidatus Saccharibacteria bacterium]